MIGSRATGKRQYVAKEYNDGAFLTVHAGVFHQQYFSDSYAALPSKAVGLKHGNHMAPIMFPKPISRNRLGSAMKERPMDFPRPSDQGMHKHHRDGDGAAHDYLSDFVALPL